MPNEIAVIILAPLVGLSLVALFVVMGAIFPRQIADVKTRSSDMPGRSFLLGLINAIFLSVIAAALSGAGDVPQLLALLLFTILVVGLAFGLAGMAPLIGERLLPESSGVRQTGWGAAIMVVASLTPFLGWFLLFPYLSFRGLGAFLLGLSARTSS
jgi:hypothetical protein